MNYIKKIVNLNLKNNKRLYILLSVVIIMTCIFTVTVTIFADSLSKTEEQQRKDIYGSWHIAIYDTDETVYEQLIHHGTIQQTSKMVGYGSVVNNENVSIGIIGSADKYLEQMGLHLQAGSFPKKDNEIVVEMSYLTMLGYSYKLGQEIPLRIQSFDRNSKELKVIEKIYILSGVLKNYSSIWKSSENQLVSFFVKENSLELPEAFKNVFCKLKKQYIQNAEEISILSLERGSYVENDYTYYEYSSKNISSKQFLSSEYLYTLLITLSSIFFIVNILQTSFKKHTKSFVVMRCIGASKLQIFKIYGREIFSVLSLNFVAGIVLGLSLSYIGYKVIAYNVKNEVIFYINTFKLFEVIFTIFLFILLISAISIFQIGKIPLTGNVQLQSDKKFKHNKKRKLVPLTTRNMIKIFNYAHRKETFTYFLLTTSTFMILSSSFYITYLKYKDYLFLKSTYTADYEYSSLLYYFEPIYHLQEDKVEQIRRVYGIDYVRAYQCSDYMSIVWDNMKTSNYAKYTAEYIFTKFNNKSAPQATVVGISEDKRDYQYYVDEIDRGSVSVEQFISGNEVILYLPTYYLTQNNKFLSNAETTYYLMETGMTIFNEDTIDVGDEITLNVGEENIKVKVGGIITEFTDENSMSFLSKPYSVLCNYKLYDKLATTDAKKSYEYLQIYCNNNANYERTDVELSQIIDGPFSNFRINKEEEKNNVMASIFLSLIISFIAIFISTTIHYNSYLSKLDSHYYRNHVLYMLGMEKWKIQFIYFYNTFKNCIISILFSLLMLYLYQSIVFSNTHNSFANIELLNQAKYVFIQYFSKLPWFYIILFCLLYLALNIFIVYYPIKIYLSKK